jgi:uncharacterized membrane protein YtjA (UPF0391 family)
MLYTGMFLFLIAIVSGLCGFLELSAAPAETARSIFYSCLSLASLFFLLQLAFLERPSDGRGIDDTGERAEPATAADAAR